MTDTTETLEERAIRAVAARLPTISMIGSSACRVFCTFCKADKFHILRTDGEEVDHKDGCLHIEAVEWVEDHPETIECIECESEVEQEGDVCDSCNHEAHLMAYPDMRRFEP